MFTVTRVYTDARAAVLRAGPHLLDALRRVLVYAQSRAEDMHEIAEKTGDPAAFADWLEADAAVTAARAWIDRLTR